MPIKTSYCANRGNMDDGINLQNEKQKTLLYAFLTHVYIRFFQK